MAFGALAAAISLLDELVTANKDLTHAKADRAAAFGPAHEKYIDFKKVVRDARGARSAEYKRIHVRASSAAEKKEPGGAAAEASPK